MIDASIGTRVDEAASVNTQMRLTHAPRQEQIEHTLSSAISFCAFWQLFKQDTRVPLHLGRLARLLKVLVKLPPKKERRNYAFDVRGQGRKKDQK